MDSAPFRSLTAAAAFTEAGAITGRFFPFLQVLPEQTLVSEDELRDLCLLRPLAPTSPRSVGTTRSPRRSRTLRGRPSWPQPTAPVPTPTVGGPHGTRTGGRTSLAEVQTGSLSSLTVVTVVVLSAGGQVPTNIPGYTYMQASHPLEERFSYMIDPGSEHGRLFRPSPSSST